MMGTLATALASKGIITTSETYMADVEGDIEDIGGVLKITRIRVNYTIVAPKGSSAGIRQTMAAYLKNCPAAQSVMGCIQIMHQAEIREM
ncbi:MAG: OsmC family protein [Proteobacteria bacterium]|nr:OsmC family protein [Pseudomonadota bacterium]MBU1449588.1 OsmC family protein [Pseudomonadota bacterium]MBU2468359.1 OsmC family protein [Pseudomonadota bacterium]MBU2516885.1 OsmC family protein [Pseudomonadota bacterium]